MAPWGASPGAFDYLCGFFSCVELGRKRVQALKPLRTQQLLHLLGRYDFYDWERLFDGRRYFAGWFGMPRSILQDLGAENLYDSWGFDAVDNPHADPKFSPELWLRMVDQFFAWLKGAEFLILGENCVVTPDLSDWWMPYLAEPPKWTARNRWKEPDYSRYMSLIRSASNAQWDPEYHGALIKTWDEFESIARMSTRNQRFQFFTGGDRVVHVTEYLTVIVDARDSETFDHIVHALCDDMSAQLLRSVSP